jgi:hypothetical protein
MPAEGGLWKRRAIPTRKLRWSKCYTAASAALRAKAGGAEGSRTPDLLIANETLYQLSYDPDQFAVTLQYHRIKARRNQRTIAKTQGTGIYQPAFPALNSRTTPAMARVCSGVLPQQEPMMFAPAAKTSGTPDAMSAADCL